MGISAHAAPAYLTDDAIESMAATITTPGYTPAPAATEENLFDRLRPCHVPSLLSAE